MFRSGYALFLTGVLLLATSWCRAEVLTSPRHELYGHCRVLSVETPNVLKVKMLERREVVTIRLLGVGSPRNRIRLSHLSSQVLCHIRDHGLWEKSRGYVESLLKDREAQVWVRKYDRRDDKKRLLGYIFLEDESNRPVDLNGEMIREGLGFVTRDYVHVTYATYKRLEDEARGQRRGMWLGLPMAHVSSLK